MIELQRLYESRFPRSEHRRRERLWEVLCEHFFQSLIPFEATVLDLGAGGGEFINAIRAQRRIAVDASPTLGDRVAPGVEALICSFSELDEKVEAGSVDACFASNVFEHLQNAEELIAVLTTVHRLLAPEGKLIIMQPNIRAVGAAFWDFVDHSLPLTEKGMAEALDLAGFRIESSRPRFLPYTTRGHLPAHPWLVRAYLKLPPLHRLLGGQMLIVARAAG